MRIPACEQLQLGESAAGVRIPLACNQNDKGSLFAGSIYAGAILAAYRAAERCFAACGVTGDLVAKEASIRYLRRIVTDGAAAAAVCGEPLLKPNGNRALEVRVTVSDASGAACAEFTGSFVLLAARGAP